jgi:hypothetical protein
MKVSELLNLNEQLTIQYTIMPDSSFKKIGYKGKFNSKYEANVALQKEKKKYGKSPIDLKIVHIRPGMKIFEKLNHWISKYSKGIDKFILWQDGPYYYTLRRSFQSPKSGKFETIKTFNDMSLDEVENWLSSSGYKIEK